MAKMDAIRLAILGAGPIGLEAALYAAHLQLPFTVYERGRVGEHLQRWGHVKLFSPFGMNVTPLGPAAVSLAPARQQESGARRRGRRGSRLHGHLWPTSLDGRRRHPGRWRDVGR